MRSIFTIAAGAIVFAITLFAIMAMPGLVSDQASTVSVPAVRKGTPR